MNYQIQQMDARMKAALQYITTHPGQSLHWQLDLALADVLHISVRKAREYVRKLEHQGVITVENWNGPVRPVTKEGSA